jgi:tyrosinase
VAGNKIIHAFVASLCLFLGASAWLFSRRQAALSLDDVQKLALAKAYKVLDGTLFDCLSRPSTCSKDTVTVRKEL